MSKREKSTNAQAVAGKGLTRRAVIAGSAAGGAALAFGGRAAFAQAADTLRIGFISPRTGALAGFGEADQFVLDLARKALAGGLESGGKKYAVEILDRDTQSDPSRASQLAKDLINGDKIDLMIATSTPEVVNPVADACEAAGLPCLSAVLPWEAWYFGRGAKPGAPSPFKWTFHYSFGVADFTKCYTSQWNGPVTTNKKVGVMYPNDADGNAIRAALAPQLEKAGFTIVDPGPYEDGTTEFSAQIALFKKEQCEIFNTFPIPPDFAAFWREAAQQGYTKIAKIVQTAKTGLFASQVEALGDLGNNLGSACYWHRDFPYKSSLTGLGGAELCDQYEAASGNQWNSQLGASLGILEAGVEALKASGNPQQKADVAKAINTLKTTTINGNVDFTAGPVAGVASAPLIGTQWVSAKPGGKHKFELVITENAGDPNVPVSSKLVSYS